MKKKKNNPIITIPHLKDTFLCGNSFVINWMLFTEKQSQKNIEVIVESDPSMLKGIWANRGLRRIA
jgi:hypothetical protein